MEIPNPRRILAVSLADSAQHLSNVIRDLTGTHPPPALREQPNAAEQQQDEDQNEETLAGTTHPLTLATPYYIASIPIWLDLIASPAEWSASFLSPEAKEVLDVLGGVLVVFALPPLAGTSSSLSSVGSEETGVSARGDGRERVRELIKCVGQVVREGLGGWEWDGVGLAVGVGAGTGAGAGEGTGDGAELDEWEDLCAEWGLEFVHVSTTDLNKSGKGEDKGKRNEFGERMGVARVLEALQANDWSGGGMEGSDGDGDGEDADSEGKGLRDQEGGEFDPTSLDFGFDRDDFVGLRKAIWAGIAEDDAEDPKRQEKDDEEVGEEDVQKLERMMMKLQAVRDASAGLPEEQRKKMAAWAVGEVMKEL